MKRIVIALLLGIIFHPVQTFSQTQDGETKARLKIVEEWRLSMQCLWKKTRNDTVQEMLQSFSFESVKAQPTASDTEPISGEKISEREHFEVVPVLDSDCRLSPFWKDICRNIHGAGFIYGSPESQPKIVIRDIPKMSSVERGLSLARAMSFLEETPDFQCPEGLTGEQAKALEHSVKQYAANRLIKRLADETAKGLPK